MAVLNKETVERPKGTYLQKHAGDVTYVYQYTSHRRLENGKSKHTSIIVGILTVDGQMHPNDNYYELNGCYPLLRNENILSWGYGHLYHLEFEKLGIGELLSEAFGEDIARKIEAASQYFVLNGESTSTLLDDWMEETHFDFEVSLLTTQNVSRLYSGIGGNGQCIEQFKKSWFAKVKNDDIIAYDVTSISSYSEQMAQIEYGYNRDHEKLAQVNVGMFCGLRSKLPASYDPYEGSISDKTNLPYILKHMSDYGVKDVSLVMDGGLCDQECIQTLNSSVKAFSVGVPSGRKMVMNLGKMLDKSEQTRHRHLLSTKGEYGYFVETELYGVKGRILVGYNEMNHADLLRIFESKLERLEQEMSTLKRMPKGNTLAKYSKFFVLSPKGKNGFSYERNFEATEEETKDLGYFFIFTTDDRLTAKDLLYLYRSKDADEKLYYQLKVYLEGNRVRVHSDDALAGKILVLFVAQIMRSNFLGKLDGFLSRNHMALPKVLRKLSMLKIRKSEKGTFFVNAPTKFQQDVFKEFGLKINLNK